MTHRFRFRPGGGVSLVSMGDGDVDDEEKRKTSMEE
jgi:hypothetical protein